MSKLWVLISIFVLGIALVFYVPDFPNVQFTSYDIPDAMSLEGKSSVRKPVLNNAEKLFLNRIKGPEALEVYDNKLYVSTHGGFIYRVLPDTLERVVKTGKSCDGFWQEKTCGRPLGFKFHLGQLFIADAYYGILKANISSGEVTSLISINKPINGKVPMLPNSLDISQDGTIYWSDSSISNFLQDGVLSMMTNGNGRVLKWDPVKKENTVLVEGLLFANGVALSPKQDFLLVAETGKSRLLKINLKGNEEITTFIDKLPGLPDNIRINNKGQVIINLIATFENKSNLAQILAPRSYIRKFIYHLFTLMDNLFIKLNSLYPNIIFEKINFWIGHFESLVPLLNKEVLIIVTDLKGQITQILEANDGSVSHISDTIEYQNYYYLGSPYNNYLGRVKKM